MVLIDAPTELLSEPGAVRIRDFGNLRMNKMEVGISYLQLLLFSHAPGPPRRPPAGDTQAAQEDTQATRSVPAAQNSTYMSQRTRSANAAPKNHTAAIRGASSARASATPERAQAMTAARSTTRQTQERLFEEARTAVPDLDAALAFLQQRDYQLIPTGEGAITKDALVTGLLHFARAAPTADLARKGLISFAFLAQELYNDQLCNADGVRDGIPVFFGFATQHQ